MGKIHRPALHGRGIETSTRLPYLSLTAISQQRVRRYPKEAHAAISDIDSRLLSGFTRRSHGNDKENRSQSLLSKVIRFLLRRKGPFAIATEADDHTTINFGPG